MTTKVPIDEEDGLLPMRAAPVCVMVGGAGTRLLAPEEGEDVSIESSLDSSLESTTITSSPAPSLRSAGSLDKGPHKGFSKCLCWLFGVGITFFLIGSLAIIFPPFDVLMNERLRMLRGFPAFEWWVEPPDEVFLRLYIFNITNKDEFLAGKQKLRLQEVGPWIFRERLRHTDVFFNDNGTMTYTAHRSAEFLPELSGNLSMDTMLVLPNLGVLGVASYMWDASFFTKLGINMMMMNYNSQPIVTMRAGDYMWNNTDPMFSMAGNIMPDLVPTTNLGILHIIYEHFSDEVTVYTGLQNSRRFFLIDKFRGSHRLGLWDGEYCDSVYGASEGVSYPQFLTRNDSLLYLRKTICRATPLYYERDEMRYNMNGLRFELPSNLYASPDEVPENKCFRRRGDFSPQLPSGATDISPCFYNFPLAASFPHFMHASPELSKNVEGLKPDPKRHGSYVIVEPTTGVPMESSARSQSNLVVRPLHGFSKVQAFSNMTIPMFWAEYTQVGLPWYIRWLMYLVVEIIQPSQQPVAYCLVTAGMSILLAAFFGWTCSRNQYRELGGAGSTPRSSSYSSLNLLPSSKSSQISFQPKADKLMHM
ncbi:scavenger receptor class B member 1-like [Cloeon dipterum]